MAAFSLKITFRHLWKSRLYSIINVTGLAIGIGCVLLAVLYWKDERSYDTFHKNGSVLYRITTSLIEAKGEKMQTTGGTGQVQGPAFKAAVPELVDFTRVMGGGISQNVIGGGKALRLQSVFADENFFNTFSFPLLRGNPNTVLSDVGSVVITETAALKYFNTLNVIGRQLEIDADASATRLGRPLVITGVAKDPTLHSSIRFDAVFPLKFMQLSFQDDNWLNAYLGTFVLLQPGANLRDVSRKFDQVYALHAREQLAAAQKESGFDPTISYGLQPVTDIHLHPLRKPGSDEEDGISNGSNPVYSYLFMGIAVFILAMAAINFVNISIAGSLKRAKEVGMRKIIGGSRIQIIRQFLGESAVLCIVAFGLALLLTRLFLPIFNQLTGKQISMADSFDLRLFFYFSAVLAAIILVAGFYPASVLSNFKPTEVLYGRQKRTGRGLFGRILTVVQFSAAVFLLVATLVYYRQMDYVRTKDLGYNPAQVVVTRIEGNGDRKQLSDRFRNELANEPSIEAVSFGGRWNVSGVELDRPSAQARPEQTPIQTVQAMHEVIDDSYLQTLQIPIKSGRNFSSAIPADKKNSVIVNEAFVQAAHLENPVGTQVLTDKYFDSTKKTIIGVVKDFHFGSLRESIQPLVLFQNDWFGDELRVKFEKPRQKEALAALQKVYTRILPRAIYQYEFLDERNAKEYAREADWQQVIRFATFLSMLICSLGLFGLAHLSTRQRVKEIGIRKVLGASVREIAGLLTGDFLRLVIIAYLIAAPIAWFVMNRWLQDFAYRISPGIGIFGLAGLIAVAMAYLSVGIQTMGAAIANPVESLRTQ